MKNDKIKNDGKNAVIYARYSSAGQREESIEGQLRDCRRFAEANDLNIIGVYVDRAITGTTDKRDDFQRMIADASKRKFQYVIVWKLDRFSRDRYDNAVYKQKLKANGVKVLYAMENIPDDPSGILLESVMEGLAEYYSVELSQKIHRGNYDSALQCSALGHPLYGYTIGEDKRYHLNEEQAAAVRMIFERYASGVSNTDIVRELNEKGYRTRKGGKFNDNYIPRMIKNEKYTGIYRYADIVIPDGIPRIIDDELFEKANSMMTKNSAAPARNRTVNYLLTGKLFCGRCGEQMSGDCGTSRNGSVKRYYTCCARKNARGCKLKSVGKDEIENRVISALTNILYDDDLLETIAAAAVEYQKETEKESPLPALRAAWKDVSRREENLMRAIELGGIEFTEIRDRLIAVKAEKKQIEEQIACEELNNRAVTADQILFFLHRLRADDPTDEAYRQTLIDTFINKIFVFDDKIKIFLNYTADGSAASAEITLSDACSPPPLGSSFGSAGSPDVSKPNRICVFSAYVLCLTLT